MIKFLLRLDHLLLNARSLVESLRNVRKRLLMSLVILLVNTGHIITLELQLLGLLQVL